MPKVAQKRLLVMTLIFGLIGLLFCFGWGIAQGKYRDLGLALQVIPYVKINYYEPVSLFQLIGAYNEKGNVQGMLETLGDPYTRYLNHNQFAELMTKTEGIYGGIGLYLDYKEDELIIMRPMRGTPAEQAGLIQGDKIVAVNGEPTKSMAQEVAIAKIRGPSGSKVKLMIKRGNSFFEVELVRVEIRIPTVEWSIKDDPVLEKVGWISLYQFSENSASDLEEALEQFTEEEIPGIVLDLRYNPGGLLTSAVQVASKFVPNGPVVYVNPRTGKDLVYPAIPDEHRRFPLVVLVNEWSASAAEIVAGAIKDRAVGTLVGNTTFGKGVVQDVIPLWGGGALTLTVANYLTAGGHSIHKKGITPDVLVGSTQEKEDILERYETHPQAETDGQLLEKAQEELERIEKRQEEKALEVLRRKVLESNVKKAA